MMHELHGYDDDCWCQKENHPLCNVKIRAVSFFFQGEEKVHDKMSVPVPVPALVTGTLFQKVCSLMINVWRRIGTH